MGESGLVTVQVEPPDHAIGLEVGWYYRIMLVNRAEGTAVLQVAKRAWVKPSLWARLRGAKPFEVVLTLEDPA